MNPELLKIRFFYNANPCILDICAYEVPTTRISRINCFIHIQLFILFNYFLYSIFYFLYFILYNKSVFKFKYLFDLKYFCVHSQSLFEFKYFYLNLNSFIRSQILLCSLVTFYLNSNNFVLFDKYVIGILF